jgi:hypothetical protein
MATLVLRLVKGSALTNAEIDTNFTNLNNDIGTRVLSTSYTASDVLTKIKTVDGSGSGLDADLIDGMNADTANTASTVVARDASGNFSANIISATLSGNASTSSACSGNSATATQLSSTTQVNVITGKIQSMPMVFNDGTFGSFNCRSTGTGDNNLAGVSFNNDTYAIKMGIRSDGVFGIGGWSRAAWSWYSDASGNMVSAGNVTAYSDPRLKTNIVKIVNPFDILNAINGVTFNWNNHSKLIQSKWGSRDYGVLADEVKAVMPEIVVPSIVDEENNETYDTVCYEKLVPVLIEAVKQLKIEIDILKGL